MNELLSNILRRFGYDPEKTDGADIIDLCNSTQWTPAENAHQNCSCELTVASTEYYVRYLEFGRDDEIKKPKRRTCAYCGTKTKKRRNCPACGAPLK